MLVKECMATPRVVMRDDTPIREAAQAFIAHGVIAAPVVDDSGVLIGIVTEIDLLRDYFGPDPRARARPAAQPGTLPPASVGEVATRSVLSSTEDADVADLSEQMMRTRIRSVPVVRAGRVVGMVGRGDLLRLLARSDDEVAAAVRRALAERGPYLPDLRVRVYSGIAHIFGDAGDAERKLALDIARSVPGVSRAAFDPAPSTADEPASA